VTLGLRILGAASSNPLQAGPRRSDKPSWAQWRPRRAILAERDPVPMQNVDFKCELRDPELARVILKRRGAMFVGAADHRDTYYRIPDGRLKKREADREPVEWIVYHRTDRPQPSISRFIIYSSDQLRERYGDRDLPEWLAFTKRREIWLMNGLRVHLDHLSELGWFCEIDALVSKTRHVVKCHEAIADIRQTLAPSLGGMIATSYADLIALERQLADEGEAEEPAWFKDWRPPEGVIDAIPPLDPSDDFDETDDRAA